VSNISEQAPGLLLWQVEEHTGAIPMLIPRGSTVTATRLSYCIAWLQVKHHVVQAVVMVTLLARLLQRLSFQDRISVITTAFMRSFPDVAAFFCAPLP
jgi:hypothetical protein